MCYITWPNKEKTSDYYNHSLWRKWSLPPSHSLSLPSLPVSFSPKRVRNIVKLRGPGASDIIWSTTVSLGSWPKGREWFTAVIGFTKRSKHILQIFVIDEAITILIDHVECLERWDGVKTLFDRKCPPFHLSFIVLQISILYLFEFLYLRLVEHGEYVRSGPLSSPLGVLF